MFLNLHERVLLRMVGLHGVARRELLRALIDDGQVGGEVDVTAQAGGFNLAFSKVRDDLATWFDELLAGHGPKADKVVYGHRSYRRPVILAAALGQADVPTRVYVQGRRAGMTSLAQFRAAARSDPGDGQPG